MPVVRRRERNSFRIFLLFFFFFSNILSYKSLFQSKYEQYRIIIYVTWHAPFLVVSFECNDGRGPLFKRRLGTSYNCQTYFILLLLSLILLLLLQFLLYYYLCSYQYNNTPPIYSCRADCTSNVCPRVYPHTLEMPVGHAYACACRLPDMKHLYIIKHDIFFCGTSVGEVIYTAEYNIMIFMLK